MTTPITTLTSLIRTARRYTPGGVLFPADLRGLFRRTAHLHGITPREVARLYHRAEEAGLLTPTVQTGGRKHV